VTVSASVSVSAGLTVSAPANIAEGEGRFGRDRTYHWRVAYSFAKELDVHLRLLLASRAVDPEQNGTGALPPRRIP